MSTDEDLSNSIYRTAGIWIAICGNVLISVALNIQRYAHLEVVKKESRAQLSHNHDKKPDKYYTNRYWWLGVLVMTLGELGNFLAYGFAPASIVSPLGVVALMSNCIIAPVFFHEKVKLANYIGISLAVLGILVILVSSGNRQEPGVPQDPLYTIHEIVAQSSFRIYLIIEVVLIALLYRESRNRESVCASTSSRFGVYELFINISLVGLFGSLTAISTKLLSSLVSSTLFRAVAYLESYILLATIVLTAISQVIFINKCLRHYGVNVVIPFHFVFFTISVVIGSAVTFHDFDYLKMTQILLFFGGCMLTFAGVILIASHTSSIQPVEPIEPTGPLEPSESLEHDEPIPTIMFPIEPIEGIGSEGVWSAPSGAGARVGGYGTEAESTGLLISSTNQSDGSGSIKSNYLATTPIASVSGPFMSAMLRKSDSTQFD